MSANGLSSGIIGTSEADYINGGDMNDVISGGAGADTLDGGAADYDTLSYALDTVGVTINLTTNTASGGDAQGDTISNFEGIYGGSGNDSLTGNNDQNTIIGNTGNDTIYGMDGNDNIEGGAGADIIDGGNGSDSIKYKNSNAGVVVNLKTNTASGGDAQGDTISNFENISGSEYDDTLTLSDIRGQVLAGAGNDTIIGGAGNDYLFGEAGNDNINGGAGADTISGSAGNDTITGGAGNDTISFLPATSATDGGISIDTLTDFNKTEDKIEFAYTTAATGELNSMFDANATANNINDYIHMAGDNMYIDRDGTTGGTVWTQIAIIQNATFADTDLTSMVNNGHIVIA
jgi:Ca2+-binding RTX toxin-like protein